MKIYFLLILMCFNMCTAKRQQKLKNNINYQTMVSLLSNKPLNAERCQVLIYICDSLLFTSIDNDTKQLINQFISTNHEKIEYLTYDQKNYCINSNTYLTALVNSVEFNGLSYYNISKQLLSPNYIPKDATIRKIYLNKSLRNLTQAEAESLILEFINNEVSTLDIIDMYYIQCTPEIFINFSQNYFKYHRSMPNKVYTYLCYQLINIANRNKDFSISIKDIINKELKSLQNNKIDLNKKLYNDLTLFVTSKIK